MPNIVSYLRISYLFIGTNLLHITGDRAGTVGHTVQHLLPILQQVQYLQFGPSGPLKIAKIGVFFQFLSGQWDQTGPCKKPKMTRNVLKRYSV